MSRQVCLLRITLQADSPISVAAPESASLKSVDLPVARDPFRDKPYIPMTGVVGSLRSHATTELAAEATLRLFGGKPAAGSKDDDLLPSLVRALGTSLTTPRPEIQVRRQTAIDRRTGSARSRALRSREVLDVGSRINVYLCLVEPTPHDMEALRTVVTTWTPVIGGGRTSGQGRCQVVDCRFRELDLTSKAGLQEWLELGGPEDWRVDGWERWKSKAKQTRPDIEIAFALVGDAHIGTGSRVDGISPTLKDHDKSMVPGTALKGVFRSRAEFVLRTLGLRACASTGVDAGEADKDLPDRCTSDPCLTCQLFGYSGSGEDNPGKRGMLEFVDSRIGKEPIERRTHVALDRFTGGQAHGLLFSQEVVSTGCLTVGIRLGRTELREVAEALIGVVATDIHDGFVGVGHGTARGMGSLQLSSADAEQYRQRWLERIELVRQAAGVAA